MPLRIVFFGTAELARASLAGLADANLFDLAAVVVQPDRPKGRDLKLLPPPVKAEALKRGLPVLQPAKARDSKFIEDLRQLQPELIAVAAYGQILPASILELPRHGCINVHTSLLPKYRGAAPIQWAILQGETHTGVTIMKMDASLDTGDILTQETVPIREADNAQTLHDQLAQTGASLLVRTIPEYTSGRITPKPQPNEGASYARKISKEDGRLNWSLPARVLWNRIRAFVPWPGAFTYLPNEAKLPLLKIWQAEPADASPGAAGEVLQTDQEGIVVACGEGALRVQQLQREGSRRMTAKEFLAGHNLRPGMRFVQSPGS